MSSPFSVSVPVRFSEVDLYRIVWHGRYTAWLEEARNRFVAGAGFSIVEFLDRGYQFPIVELSIQYKRPARYGDTLLVLPRYEPEQIARITFHYEIRLDNSTADLLATATTRQVILRNGELLVTKPEDVKVILARLEALQSGA